MAVAGTLAVAVWGMLWLLHQPWLWSQVFFVDCLTGCGLAGSLLGSWLHRCWLPGWCTLTGWLVTSCWLGTWVLTSCWLSVWLAISCWLPVWLVTCCWLAEGWFLTAEGLAGLSSSWRTSWLGKVKLELVALHSVNWTGNPITARNFQGCWLEAPVPLLQHSLCFFHFFFARGRLM